MESLPPPPLSLPALEPDDLLDLGGSDVFRIYPSAGDHPLRWDEPRVSPLAIARLDPHGAVPVGVWYAASDLPTALAETFQETRTVHARPDRPRVCMARLTRAQVLNLFSDWSVRAGCGGLLGTAPHEETQPWAAAIRAAYPSLDGALWPSSVRPSGSNLVLWMPPRTRPALEARPLMDRAVDDPAITETILGVTRRIGYAYGFPL